MFVSRPVQPLISRSVLAPLALPLLVYFVAAHPALGLAEERPESAEIAPVSAPIKAGSVADDSLALEAPEGGVVAPVKGEGESSSRKQRSRSSDDALDAPIEAPLSAADAASESASKSEFAEKSKSDEKSKSADGPSSDAEEESASAASKGEGSEDSAQETQAASETEAYDPGDSFGQYDFDSLPSLESLMEESSQDKKPAKADVPRKTPEPRVPQAPYEGPPRVFPITLELDGNTAAQAAVIRQVLDSALTRATRVVPLNAAAVLDPIGIAERKRHEERALDALIHGRKAFDSLDYGLAVEFLERAIAAFEQSSLGETFPNLLEAMVYRIIIRWSDDPIRTRPEIERLLAIAPKIRFPTDVTPDDLQTEVARQRQNQVAERKFSLDVNASPVAAEVYVNGVFRGTTPAQIRGLVAGDHYVSLVAPGYRVEQQKVRVQAGASHSVVLKQAERSNPFHTFIERVRDNFGKDSELPHAQNLARLAQSEELLAVGISRDRGRVSVSMHRVARDDGHVLGVEELRLDEGIEDFEERVEAAALRLLATDRPRGSKGEPKTFKSGFAAFMQAMAPTETSVKIGTLVTGGMLLVAGGTLGYFAYDHHQDFRNIPQTSRELDAHISKGRAMAISSDVLVGLALAAGGVWAWLEFGTKHNKRIEIPSEPVLEGPGRRSAPPSKPERKAPDGEDPFAFRPSSQLEFPGSFASSQPGDSGPGFGSVHVFASPTLDGGVLGVKGSF